MTRGESTQTKVHYKTGGEDFIIFVDDVDAYKKFRDGDTTIAMAHFMSNMTIYLTHKQGAQGRYDTAPQNVLSSAFPDQKNDEDIIKEILQKGDFQTMEMPGRQGATNDSMSFNKTK
ncbi:hypothetical protein NLU13_9149 [Sarocladium strictum]|uniref:Ribosome maturation protein SDO1/SBDS N-terminal domain-containing protein n=1 Tax=Sarocladium strictum TaxID=5046 RepID=A0AA39L3L6_SARSR|nr:hypothetical protein NLU13_9149 [Sarocladium strictum]